MRTLKVLEKLDVANTNSPIMIWVFGICFKWPIIYLAYNILRTNNKSVFQLGISLQPQTALLAGVTFP